MAQDTAANVKYLEVGMDQLKSGMLVERPLYLYLEGNNRYIRMVKPLHPLEDRVVEKIARFGKAYSTEGAIEERLPQLTESAAAVRDLCDDVKAAPFEKNRAIRSLTEWLVQDVFHRGHQSVAPLFFFHRAFGVPHAETLIFVSDLSVVMYERALRHCSLAGVLAMWLGYSNTRFLGQFAQMVFCEEVGRYIGTAPHDVAPQVKAGDLEASLQMIRSGTVPGVSLSDHRFTSILKMAERCAAMGDELQTVAALALSLADGRREHSPELVSSRVARKLAKQFGVDLGAGLGGAPERERGVA